MVDLPTGRQTVSVQTRGTGKPSVGATLVVARFANPDIGGPPAGRPQGSPLRRPFPILNLNAYAKDGYTFRRSRTRFFLAFDSLLRYPFWRRFHRPSSIVCIHA